MRARDTPACIIAPNAMSLPPPSLTFLLVWKRHENDGAFYCGVYCSCSQFGAYATSPRLPPSCFIFPPVIPAKSHNLIHSACLQLSRQEQKTNPRISSVIILRMSMIFASARPLCSFSSLFRHFISLVCEGKEERSVFISCNNNPTPFPPSSLFLSFLYFPGGGS